MNTKLSFLDGWKVELSKLPNYERFRGEFIEGLDYHLLQLIHDSEFLESKPEIKANLKNVLESVNKQTGELKVVHDQRFKCGRFYANNSISIIPLSKYVKHTVFKYLGWLDIDMVKGHPSIAIEMGKLINHPFPAFENYVNNFDKSVKILSEFYSANPENPLDKDNIKWLFNSMIYGGGFNGWIEGVMKGDETYPAKQLKNENVIHDIIKNFKNECLFISNKIYKDNPALAKKVSEKKDELHQKKSSTCAYWFGIIENHIVHMVAEFLLERNIIKPRRFGEEMDGLNLPPCNISNKDELINDINTLVKLKTGMDIKFKFKDYDDAYILYDVIEKRKSMIIAPIVESPHNEQVDMKSLIDERLHQLIGDFIQTQKVSDYDIAKVISVYYPERFVFADYEKNTWYEFAGHRWIPCKGANTLLTLISEDFRNIIYESLTTLTNHNSTLKNDSDKKECSKLLATFGDVWRRVGTTSDKKNILAELKNIFFKDKFEEQLDQNINLLCFTNGVFDSRTLTFRDGNPKDMCSLCTNIDLIELDDEAMEYMEDVKRRLFYEPLGYEVGDYFLLNIALAMAGKRLKRIVFGLGGTNRGKSTITTACINSFGDYAGAFNAENLAYRNSSQDEAQIMRWALLLQHKRIIFSNEMKSTVELNGNMIKKISSGGDRIIGRKHCQEETGFVCDFLAFCMSNDLNNIKPYDEAISKRVRVIPYEKEFVDEPENEMQLKKDPDLEEEMKTDLFKQVFMSIVILRYDKFVRDENSQETEPADVISAKREWTGDDGKKHKFVNKFLEDYEISNNEKDYITSKEMEEWLKTKNLGISYILFTKEIKTYCVLQKFGNVKSKVKKVNGKTPQVWVGIRKKSETPEIKIEIEPEDECDYGDDAQYF
jgi:phage/plasmid-associated DNA primase